MSVYQKLAAVIPKFIGKPAFFKYGFNYSPMYRRSTARIIAVSEDLKHIRIRLGISYKNRNYVNSIFGGSMFSAVDPIPMVQLIQLIGDDYVVWDKSAEINFRRPAREDLYADFIYTEEELDFIRNEVAEKDEIDIVKTTKLTNKEGSKLFCQVDKTIYIAKKDFYKEKLKRREKTQKKSP
ncbi:MAG: DUF4442 domain-containing protein [Bacteroidota bacterium]